MMNITTENMEGTMATEDMVVTGTDTTMVVMVDTGITTMAVS